MIPRRRSARQCRVASPAGRFPWTHKLQLEPLEDRRLLAVAAVDDLPDAVVAEAGGAAAGFDFGDAPAPYPTTLAADGPRHEPSGPMLGASRDEESDGQPSSDADGDGADEDGATFGSLRVGQLGASVTVNVQNASAGAKFDAWIDFNGDGSWGGPGEQIFDTTPVNNGDRSVPSR